MTMMTHKQTTCLDEIFETNENMQSTEKGYANLSQPLKQGESLFPKQTYKSGKVNTDLHSKFETSGGEDAIFQATGTVLMNSDGRVRVVTSDGTFTASQAVSCLVAPEEGDLVLLAVRKSEVFYVLAVLDRPGTGGVKISTARNLSIELSSGRFTVGATEGINLISKEAVSVVADRLEVRGREGKLFLNSVQFVAGVMDSTLERLSQTVKRVYRRVTELEHVRAGHIDYASEGTLRLHGKHTLLTARELVKSDAKQIHIG